MATRTCGQVRSRALQQGEAISGRIGSHCREAEGELGKLCMRGWGCVDNKLAFGEMGGKCGEDKATVGMFSEVV